MNDCVWVMVKRNHRGNMYREEVKAKVELGIQQIANGEYVEYTNETLHKLFDDIEEKGMKRVEAKRESVGH